MSVAISLASSKVQGGAALTGTGTHSRTTTRLHPGIPPLRLFDLLGRRAAAYAHLPLRLADCKPPIELVAVQVGFAHGTVSELQS